MKPILIVALLTLVSAGFPPALHASGEYSCPPCECASDNLKFDEPGPCPGCGMTMVSGGRLNVAILIFDDMQILDFAGPMDVLVTKSEELNV